MNPIDQKNAFALQAPASADTTPAEADPRYRDTADNRVAEVMAGQHAFGIADTILRQLLPTAAASSTAALKSGEQAVALPLVNRADPHQ